MLAVGFLVAGPAAVATTTQPPNETVRGAAVVPGSYVVTLRATAASTVDSIASSLTSRYGGTLGFVYHSALQGFSVKNLSARDAARLGKDVQVAAIQPDYKYTIQSTQTPATWGLDRIDQHNLPLDNRYTYTADGAGVHAYDIDSGVRFTHNDFKNPNGTSRLSFGTDTVGDGQNGNDCQGHGTHTAGTIGSNTWGVAKRVQIVVVRVLDCSGSGSSAGITAGLDWIVANAIKPAVANMSIGSMSGITDAAIDAGVNRVYNSGITISVAAGNGVGNGVAATNACNSSPSDVPNAITVSATDNTDTKPVWANFGKCVDLFAPGLNVMSTYNTSDDASALDSGTSMAAPHVTGAAAAWLSSHTTATPAQVTNALVSNTTYGVVKSPGLQSPNKLLYTGFITGGTPSDLPPTANFTSSCSSTNTTCSFTDSSSDPDGTVTSRSWAFGDGGTSTATSPSHTYATAGTYTVTLTVTDNAGLTGSKSSTVAAGTVTDPDPSTPNLVSGTATSGGAAAANGFKYYKIQVPAGKTSLATILSWTQSCGLLGISCTPDLDLYVQKDVKPTTSSFACSSATSSDPEQCTVSNPVATWYYIGVYTYAGSAGAPFSIKSTFS